MSDAPLRIVMTSDRMDRPVTGTYALDLARELRASGHEVFLIVRELPDPGEGETAPVRLCRRLNAWTAGGSMREFLLDELRAFAPALVHATDPTLGSAAREIAQRLGCPCAVTVHAWSARDWSPVDIEGHHVLATGPALAEDLARRLGLAPGRVSVVPPGTRVMPGRLPGAPVPGRMPVVGAAGPLEYAEGQRFLLDAARRLLDGGLDLHVLLVGSGPERSGLRRQAAELKLDDVVTFVEDPSRPREVIEVMDVFVSPTTREFLGPMMLEAMASGKPVVASDARDAVAAAQHERTALVFPKGDAAALADGVRRMIFELELAVRLAREARELVRSEFSVEAMARRTVEVYRAVLASFDSDRRPATPRE